jgi:hypothetical protein
MKQAHGVASAMWEVSPPESSARFTGAGRPMRLRLVHSCILLVAYVGCQRAAPVAQVVGAVTLNGKVVTSGDVVLVGSDGRAPPPGRVRGDGTYFIERAPIGRVKVGFFNPPPPALPAGGAASGSAEEELLQMREAAKSYTPTPAKYAEPSQSGIEFDLKPGRNVCNVELR